MKKTLLLVDIKCKSCIISLMDKRIYCKESNINQEIFTAEKLETSMSFNVQ